MSVFTSCNAQQTNKNMKQELPEKALCLFHEDKDGLSYLTSVSLLTDYLKQYVTFIGNGDYFLTYNTEYKSKSTKYDSRTDNSYTLHVIPENNDRFRFEVRLESSTFYDNGENAGHAHPIGDWNFAGYSDEDNEAAKVFKYFDDKRLEYLNNRKTITKPYFIDSLIFSDDENYISRLGNLYRDDRKNYLPAPVPYIGKNDFFLWCSVFGQYKTKNMGDIENFILHIIPEKGSYKTKVRWLGRSTFANNTLYSITGGNGWTDGDEFGTCVLNFFLEHKSEIRTMTDDEK